MTRNEIILGVVALVLVAFSLIVALVLPGRIPGFPRNLRAFVAVSILLVAGMLTAVEIFGEEKELGAAEAGEVKDTGPGDTAGPAPTTTAETATLPTETTETEGGQGGGDPAAGQEVFASAQPTCGSCHTLAAADATGTVGPNLDDSLRGKEASYIEEAIVDPDAEVAEGYQPGVMPQDYGETLSSQQIADLVAFLAESAP